MGRGIVKEVRRQERGSGSRRRVVPAMWIRAEIVIALRRGSISLGASFP